MIKKLLAALTVNRSLYFLTLERSAVDGELRVALRDMVQANQTVEPLSVDDDAPAAAGDDAGALAYGRARVVNRLERMVQHQRVQGVVWQRNLGEISAKRRHAAGRIARFVKHATRITGIEPQVSANHAPAHGIHERCLATYPKQRVAVEAARAAAHRLDLLVEETQARS